MSSKVFRVGVKIMPRKEILDTQGRTVEKLLVSEGFGIQQCRVGKWIELFVTAVSEEEALWVTRKAADFVLYNPLIEDYELEVREA